MNEKNLISLNKTQKSYDFDLNKSLTISLVEKTLKGIFIRIGRGKMNKYILTHYESKMSQKMSHKGDDNL
jgi:hypothetical protein